MQRKDNNRLNRLFIELEQGNLSFQRIEEILRKCHQNIKNVKLTISKKSDSETIFSSSFCNLKARHIKF